MTLPRRIVCGTDLGAEDRALAEQAAALATAIGAGELLLVHATAPDVHLEDVPASIRPAAQAMGERVEAQIHAEESALEKEAARLARVGLRVLPRREASRPYEALVKVGDEAEASLVVVGARPEKLFGRTVDHVVRHVHAPIAALPAGTTLPPAGKGPLLVAFDMTEASGRALVLADALAQRFGLHLAIAHVGDAAEPTVREEMAGFLTTRFPEVAERAALTLVPLETSVADALSAQAKAIGASMIAVGSHGRTGLRRAILGSVAEAMMHAARVPVLIAH